MPGPPRRTLVIALLVLLAGCATGGLPPTPEAAPSTSTPEPASSTSTPADTPSSPTTATETTTVPPGNRVPLALSNRNGSAHDVELVVTSGTTTVFDGTVRLGPAGNPNATKENVTLLTGRGTTFTISATTENGTLTTDVTLTYGVLEEHVVVNRSGGLEHRELKN